MANESNGSGYADGQASMVLFFASCIVALPLDSLVEILDRAEACETPSLDDSYSHRAVRAMTHDTARILLDAKKSIVALHTAYAAAGQIPGRIRDSRPPLPVPLDPTRGRALHAEGTGRD